MRVRADFNGIFGELLCLSHSDTCETDTGKVLRLSEGVRLTAYEEDFDASGNRDDLVATGIVERSPKWLKCNGSKWVLRLDQNGVRHASDLETHTCDG